MTPETESSLDAPGTLVVRVTMNKRLFRAAFASTVLYLAWCVIAIGGAVVLVLSSRGSAGTLVIAGLLIGWCAWTLLRTVPHALRKHRVLSMGVPTLQLDDLGVRVRDVPTHLDGASLAWTDCAAVVVSSAPRRQEWAVQPVRYVQFIASSPDRIGTSARTGRADVRADVLGTSEADALLTWLELPGSAPGSSDVVEWLRTHQPRIKLVGAGHSDSDE